jgi:hypothetical protein
MKAHTSSAQAFTRHCGFGDVAPNVSIFAVQQGVSAVAALEYAQCLLSAASTQVRAAADAARDTDDANINWGTYYLLECVEALLSASINGMQEAK